MAGYTHTVDGNGSEDGACDGLAVLRVFGRAGHDMVVGLSDMQG